MFSRSARMRQRNSPPRPQYFRNDQPSGEDSNSQLIYMMQKFIDTQTKFIDTQIEENDRMDKYYQLLNEQIEELHDKVDQSFRNQQAAHNDLERRFDQMSEYDAFEKEVEEEVMEFPYRTSHDEFKELHRIQLEMTGESDWEDSEDEDEELEIIEDLFKQIRKENEVTSLFDDASPMDVLSTVSKVEVTINPINCYYEDIKEFQDYLGISDLELDERVANGEGDDFIFDLELDDLIRVGVNILPEKEIEEPMDEAYEDLFDKVVVSDVHELSKTINYTGSLEVGIPNVDYYCLSYDEFQPVHRDTQDVKSVFVDEPPDPTLDSCLGLFVEDVEHKCGGRSLRNGEFLGKFEDFSGLLIVRRVWKPGEPISLWEGDLEFDVIDGSLIEDPI